MRLFAFSLLLFIGTNVLLAQSPTTCLTGTIKDAKEGLQGASVLAIHKTTGKQYGVLTDIEGHFTINKIASNGAYKICVSYLGFQSVEQSDVYISAGAPLVYDVTLKEATNILEVANIVCPKKEAPQEPSPAVTGLDRLK